MFYDTAKRAFDFLASISGVDLGDKLQCVYHLYSYRHRQALVLKADVPYNDPALPSVVDVWPAANWLEREQYDLMGLRFTGHPDLRRIMLPEDWVASDRNYAEVSWGGMEYVQPNLWLQVTRYYRSSSDTPRYYTFLGDRRLPGRMAMSIFPYPDSAKTIDAIYFRRPRRLTMESYSTGTVTVSAASATVTGSGTVWTSAMEGSVIRLSNDATNLPTDLAGANPYGVERTIKLVSSTTQLTVDESISTAFTAVKYQISDPIDVEDGAMLEAYFRCCEKHLAIMRRLKDADDCARRYVEALIRAEEADSRSFAGRVAGEGGPYRQRLARMPLGPDIS